MAEDGVSEAPAPTSSIAAGQEAAERRRGGRKRKRVASNKREYALQQRDGCVICLCPLPDAQALGSGGALECTTLWNAPPQARGQAWKRVCLHSFHESCARMYFSRRTNCQTCRGPVEWLRFGWRAASNREVGRVHVAELLEAGVVDAATREADEAGPIMAEALAALEQEEADEEEAAEEQWAIALVAERMRASQEARLAEEVEDAFERRIASELSPQWRVRLLSMAMGASAPWLAAATLLEAREAAMRQRARVLGVPHGHVLFGLGIWEQPKARGALPVRNEALLALLCEAGLEECVRWLTSGPAHMPDDCRVCWSKPARAVFVENAVRDRLRDVQCCA